MDKGRRGMESDKKIVMKLLMDDDVENRNRIICKGPFFLLGVALPFPSR